MKRKASSSPEPKDRKAPKPSDYCDVPVRRDEAGNEIWPAPESQMKAAREFIREW
jgi:hypothetical protein